jgi:SPP1 gp7 family putative phage head morphogenesis protein
MALNRQQRAVYDLAIWYQVQLERYKKGEITSLDDTIRKFDRSVQQRLQELGANESTATVERQLRALREDILGATDEHAKAFIDRLGTVNAKSGQMTEAVVAATAPSKVARVGTSALWKKARESTIQAAGANLDDFVGSWGRRAVDRIEKTVRTGYAQGLDSYKIIQQIRGTKANNFKDGILGGVTRREAEAMMRTSVQHAASSAQVAVYEANDDIIEGYIWISTLDDRTSSQCRSLDTMQFEIGKGPLPPLHINCRSTTIPKIKGVDLLSEAQRASPDGPVAADTSYYEWLKRQSKSTQEEILGKKQAALFRSKGMTPEKFATLKMNKEFTPIDRKGFTRAVDAVAPPPPKPPEVPKVPVTAATEKYKDFDYKTGFIDLRSTTLEERRSGMLTNAQLLKMKREELYNYIKSHMAIDTHWKIVDEALQKDGIWRKVVLRYNELLKDYDLPYLNGFSEYIDTRTAATANMAFRVINFNIGPLPVGKALGNITQTAEMQIGNMAGGKDALFKLFDLIADRKYHWTVGTTDAAQVFVHELGHILDGDLRITHSLYTVGKGYTWTPLAQRIFFDNPNRMLVSQYGATNPLEYVAEAFAMWIDDPPSEHWRIHPELLELFEKKLRRKP